MIIWIEVLSCTQLMIDIIQPPYFAQMQWCFTACLQLIPGYGGQFRKIIGFSNIDIKTSTEMICKTKQNTHAVYSNRFWYIWWTNFTHSLRSNSIDTHAYLRSINTLRPRQNVRHFPDDIFKCVFMNENVWNVLHISLKFVPRVRINNIPALVQIKAWRRPGDKPLSDPMMVSDWRIYASLGLNELNHPGPCGSSYCYQSRPNENRNIYIYIYIFGKLSYFR